jgi:hypothetical protein
MDKREIKMKPGRELDLLVAEKVMGLTKTDYLVFDKDSNIVGDICDFPKSYSTDISAAWEVVEKMKEEWGTLDITFRYDNIAVILYSTHQTGHVKISEHIGNADTAPHAICLAALKAKGVEV